MFLLTLKHLEYIIAKKERRERMSDTNQDLLLKIYEELKETKEKVQDIPEMKKQLEEIPKIKNDIAEMKKQLEEIPKMKKQLEEIPKMKKQLEEIPKIKEQLEEIPKMKKQLEEIPKMQDDILQIKKILEEIPKMKKQLEEIPEMKQELRSISGSVARIEVEHGEKLAVLFDAFKVNTEKIEEQNKRITKCENMLEQHDHQIYILNSKIQNKEIQNA